MVDVCLLGCGGMMPLPERKLTALLYRQAGEMILVDCGEGTQVQIKQAGWGFKAIRAVCFTHYHADHIAGLPGLLLTLANSGKTKPLSLIGPPGLLEAVRGLTVIVPALPFDLNLHVLPDTSETFMRIGNVLLGSAPADHRVPCLGYSLRLERAGRFDALRARALGIPVACWNRLQHGERVLHNGKTYEPKMVLGPPRRGIKISYCTDTRPTGAIETLCRDSDLLVCEGMYGEDERAEDAAKKKHMIFSEAAQMAARAACGELWLTHYSPSVKDPEKFIQNASRFFKNVHAGADLMKKAFQFSEK